MQQGSQFWCVTFHILIVIQTRIFDTLFDIILISNKKKLRQIKCKWNIHLIIITTFHSTSSKFNGNRFIGSRIYSTRMSFVTYSNKFETKNLWAKKIVLLEITEIFCYQHTPIFHADIWNLFRHPLQLPIFDKFGRKRQNKDFIFHRYHQNGK